MTSQNVDVELAFAGEVATGTQDAPYALGDSLGGNITPVDVNIAELGVKGDILGSGDICLQVFDTDGSWKSYYYLTLAGTFWLDDGWYKDLDGTPVTEEDVLTPGAGFFMTSQNVDIEITFPDPLRK